MTHLNNIYQQRLTAVRQNLAAWHVEAILISSPTNRRWLSGFTGSNAQLLITADKAIIATDFRYYEQAAHEAPQFTLFKHERTAKDDTAFLNAATAQTIGVEAKHVTLEEMEKLETAVSTITFIPLPATVEPLRGIKSPPEIEAIRAAAAITDAAMARVHEFAQPGKSEREVAWQLEKTMREGGADAVAFPVIVASGPNAALPHHHPGSRQLQIGDSIIVDMGAMLNRYRSDMTRSFFLGNKPTTQYWNVYNTVLAAQTAVLNKMRPGMKNKEIDSIARDHIGNAGHADHFGHGLGHGVGLDIHEDPFLSFRSEDNEHVTVGMTITIEPGIYIPNWGGVRIEDLGVFTETGVELLSYCPKTPIIPIM
ncbi:MAG: M24 family metallopeptidase [Chloroflexi bacterium]|nr:M24 family metallopeptidase [Chloroflexota bacterium]